MSTSIGGKQSKKVQHFFLVRLPHSYCHLRLLFQNLVGVLTNTRNTTFLKPLPTSTTFSISYPMLVSRTYRSPRSSIRCSDALQSVERSSDKDDAFNASLSTGREKIPARMFRLIKYIPKLDWCAPLFTRSLQD